MGNIETIHIDDHESRIDELLDGFPLELRERWANKIEGMDPVEAVIILEKVYSEREKAVSQGAAHLSREAEHDPILRVGIEKAVSELERSFGDPALFLGDGNVAEVYRLASSPQICIKTVTNPTAYANGNTIYQEGQFLDDLNSLVVDGVRTPKFYFYHDSIRMRSLGMETIEGSSLSKIFTDKIVFPEIEGIVVDDFARKLRNYIEEMHARKIYHGDMAERNVMIDRATLNPRIIDFGKAKRFDFDNEVGGYEESDHVHVKHVVRSLERYLKGENVDLIG